MKSMRFTLPICALALLALASTAVAQDADKSKLIEIEKALAANANPGEKAAALAKQDFYDGSLNQLTGTGRIGTLPKARVVELFSAPDPSDPAVKTTQTVADFHVDVYGTTALVAYKTASTDTGHKDPALNVTLHLGCLDTFVKKDGAWKMIGSACSSDAEIPQSVWDAIKKARMQEPKDIQQAYH
jgi:hypothetical protein